MGKMIDLTGLVFSQLTVLCRDANALTGAGRGTKWLCSCSCGAVVSVFASNLRRGLSNRCVDCARLLMRGGGGWDKTHGECASRLYVTWGNMVQRCENPKHPSFKRYGGRGITICRDWRNFEGFRSWSLQNGYADDLTIDRVNVDGNYEPHNCEWITNSENCRRAMQDRVRRKEK